MKRGISMRDFWRFFILALASALLAPLAQADARKHKFVIDPGGGSSVQFVSDAPLETITGKTTDVSGQLDVDYADIEVTRGEISASTASIKTNLPLRDEHLAGEDWLDAKRYPSAHFTIEKVLGHKALKPYDVVEVEVVGSFTLRNVTRKLVTHARIRFTPDMKPVLHILTSFVIHLEDYGIAVPKLVSLKVAPDVVVNVDIRAVASSAHPPQNL